MALSGLEGEEIEIEIDRIEVAEEVRNNHRIALGDVDPRGGNLKIAKL